MAKRKKSQLWLCRDKSNTWVDIEYTLYVGKAPSRKNLQYGAWRNADKYACRKDIHRLGLRLKPGEGPVEVELTFVKKEK